MWLQIKQRLTVGCKKQDKGHFDHVFLRLGCSSVSYGFYTHTARTHRHNLWSGNLYSLLHLLHNRIQNQKQHMYKNIAKDLTDLCLREGGQGQTLWHLSAECPSQIISRVKMFCLKAQ